MVDLAVGDVEVAPAQRRLTPYKVDVIDAEGHYVELSDEISSVTDDAVNPNTLLHGSASGRGLPS